MPGIEMRMQWSLADVVGYVETWSAVRAMAKAEGRAPIDAFYARLCAAWGDERGRQDARAPIDAYAGRVLPVRSGVRQFVHTGSSSQYLNPVTAGIFQPCACCVSVGIRF